MRHTRKCGCAKPSWRSSPRSCPSISTVCPEFSSVGLRACPQDARRAARRGPRFVQRFNCRSATIWSRRVCRRLHSGGARVVGVCRIWPRRRSALFEAHPALQRRRKHCCRGGGRGARRCVRAPHVQREGARLHMNMDSGRGREQDGDRVKGRRAGLEFGRVLHAPTRGHERERERERERGAGEERCTACTRSEVRQGCSARPDQRCGASISASISAGRPRELRAQKFSVKGNLRRRLEQDHVRGAATKPAAAAEHRSAGTSAGS